MDYDQHEENMQTARATMPPRDLTPIEEQTSRLNDGLASLEQEIGKLESRLHPILNPKDDRFEETLGPLAATGPVQIQNPNSPLVNELGADASLLNLLTMRLATLHDRIEL